MVLIPTRPFHLPLEMDGNVVAVTATATLSALAHLTEFYGFRKLTGIDDVGK